MATNFKILQIKKGFMGLAFVLKEERKKRCYSMRQFCSIIGIPLSVYHGWENGAAPKLNTRTYTNLRRIKEYYGISWEYLFEGSDSILPLIKASLFLSEFIQEQCVHSKEQSCLPK